MILTLIVIGVLFCIAIICNFIYINNCDDDCQDFAMMSSMVGGVLLIFGLIYYGYSYHKLEVSIIRADAYVNYYNENTAESLAKLELVDLYKDYKYAEKHPMLTYTNKKKCKEVIDVWEKLLKE